MHEDTGILILIFVVTSLLIGSAMRSLLRRTNVPYTVALLLVGLAFGLVQRTHFFQDHIPVVSATLELVSGIDPHLILFVFLPTLLFESTFAMEVHLFRRILPQIAILAVPGLILATTATAALAKYLFPWDWGWPLCFLFGALVSATDPVAVVALLKEVSSRKRLETLIEGESLLNDGTAIVLFTLFYGLVVVQADTGFSAISVVGEFTRVVVLGMVIGLIVGALAIAWIGRVFNQPMVEIAVSIAAAYLVFILAENAFHVSGVVAVVALALLFAGVGRTRISPEVSSFLHHFWQMMAHIANTLIFLLVGVLVASRVPLNEPSLWTALAVLFVGVQIIRTMAVGALMPVLQRVGIGITRQKAIVLVWGGLRGAVSLALALIVAQEASIPQAVGDQVLFLCAGLVVLTILINGTSMRAVLRWLQLDRLPPGKLATFKRAQHTVSGELGALLPKLQDSEFLRSADWTQAKAMVRLPDSLAETAVAVEFEASEEDQVIAFRRRLLETERRHYWIQFEEGTLSRSATHRLVELVEHALDEEPQIHPRPELQTLWRIPKVLGYLRRRGFLGELVISLSCEHLVLGYDVAQGFIRAQDEIARHIDELAPTTVEAQAVRGEVLQNKRETFEQVERLRQTFPEISGALETNAATRMLLNRERAVIHSLVESAVLDDSEAERMVADVESRMASLQKLNLKVHRPDPAELIAQASWVRGLRQTTVAALVAVASERIYGINEIIVRQGAEGGSLGIVSRGTIEITERQDGRDHVVNVLGSGALIGTRSLQSGINPATVRAIAPVSVLWLEAGKLKPIIAADAALATRINQLVSTE